MEKARTVGFFIFLLKSKLTTTELRRYADAVFASWRDCRTGKSAFSFSFCHAALVGYGVYEASHIDLLKK